MLFRSRDETIEAVAARGERFDVVLAMEVVEHVSDRAGFLRACCTTVKPGGLLFAATINRTMRSFALAIVGAEYVLGWLPRGTHDWRKFVRPSELVAALRPHGVTVRDLSGLNYSLLDDSWSVGRDLSVNYLAYAAK